MGNPRPSQNMTDKRFFWLSVYIQPALWIVLGILAIVRFRNPIWLILIGELESALEELWGEDWLMHGSDCSDTYDHEYPGIFAM